VIFASLQQAFARTPNIDGLLDAHRIHQPEIAQFSAELAICVVAGICMGNTIERNADGRERVI
jgi:hypothetical protein